MGTVGHRGRGLRTVLNETLRQIETVTGIVAIHAIVPMRIAAAAAVNAQPALRPGRSYVKDTAGCAIGAHSASDGSRPAWCSEMGRGRPFSSTSPTSANLIAGFRVDRTTLSLTKTWPGPA